VLINTINLAYHPNLMAAAGQTAAAAAEAAYNKGGYVLAVEGGVPTAFGGRTCWAWTYNGVEVTFQDTVKHLAGKAAAILSVGTCASFGGIPAAAPNPTGAISVMEAVPGATIVNLPGCPVNADNLTATIVHFLTFGRLPATDRLGRPKFAYGKRIHDNCERRGHFDAGQYAQAFGTPGHRQGHCLYQLGCKGPETFHNCPTVRYNEGTSWPIMAGHGCIGCAEPGFWDTMSPFYRRLPKVPGFGVEDTVDKIGMGLAAATAVAFGLHGVASCFRKGDAMEEDKVVKED
jgi:hydrogenase small subunit